MTEAQRDNVQEAAEKFADAIKGMAGEKSRVVVFYMYLDGEDWCSGDAGNMNWIERLGAAKRISDMARDQNSKM